MLFQLFLLIFKWILFFLIKMKILDYYKKGVPIMYSNFAIMNSLKNKVYLYPIDQILHL